MILLNAKKFTYSFTIVLIAAGFDYSPLPSGTALTFGPGKASRQCVRISIREDSFDEPNEDFRVIIEKNDDQLSISPGEETSTVTITDDDGECH